MRWLMLLPALLLTGCAARPAPVKPAQALQAALAHPHVAAWHEAHSAPRVLEGLNPTAVKGLGRYRPVAMVDRVSEGLLVRFDSALGPRPRRVEVIIDQQTGAVLEAKQR
ncbi:MAG: hypothetical protein ACOY93_00050 [Bacillota bacterium]